MILLNKAHFIVNQTKQINRFSKLIFHIIICTQIQTILC